MIDGEVQADDSTIAVSQDVGPLDFQLPQQLRRVLSHRMVFHRPAWIVSSPSVAHLLWRNHLVLLGKILDGLRPNRDGAHSAMEDKKRRALAVNFVVHLQPMHGGIMP